MIRIVSLALLLQTCGETPQIAGPVELRTVTIYRDEFSMAHIVADTEEEVMYGHGWAQAENDLESVLRNLLGSHGELAAYAGADEVDDDLQMRKFRVPCTPEEYESRIDPYVKTLLAAFVEGINRYVREHGAEPRYPAWISGVAVTPLHVASMTRAENIGGAIEVARKDFEGGGAFTQSNTWAIAPSRSLDRRTTMVVGDPHQNLSDTIDLKMQVHLRAAGMGLDAAGTTVYGIPFVYLGHNRTIGWGGTAARPDIADVYRETVDQAGSRPTWYKDWRVNDFVPMEEVSIEVPVAGEATPRVFTTHRTMHGPVAIEAGEIDEYAYVFRLGNDGATDGLNQIYRMNRVEDINGVVELLETQNYAMKQNLLFADRTGEIFYRQGARIPRKQDKGWEHWARPVDGTDPSNEWETVDPGDPTSPHLVHDFSDVPQLRTPAEGYIQVNNCPPWHTRAGDAPGNWTFAAEYLVSMDRAALPHARTVRALELLDPNSSFDLDVMRSMVGDTLSVNARNLVPELIAAIDDQGAMVPPDRVDDVVAIRAALSSWDFRYALESPTAGAFTVWLSEFYSSVPAPQRTFNPEDPNLTFSPEEQVAAMTALLWTQVQLETAGLNWSTPWGDFHLLERGDRSVRSAGGLDIAPTLFMVDGTMDVLRSAWICGAVPGSGGSNGTTLTLLRPDSVESWHVLPYGNSGDPKSVHYFDQAENLYRFGLLKKEPFEEWEYLASRDPEHPDPTPLRW